MEMPCADVENLILSKNLKQNWNLDTDLWNEEFPHDYRFEDTYLQLSFVLRDFNIKFKEIMVKKNSSDFIYFIIISL